MEQTIAVGTKSSPHRSGLGSGSRPGLAYQDVRASLAVTPPPQKCISLPSEPEPTAHAGGAATAGLPNIGDVVLGFRIVEKLGQGGFGSVFLGEQVGLADRPVALKFTTRPTTEPERMAALQHTNVVPVYSVHSQPPLQVLCMPYRGRHTLADAMRAIARTKSLPATGAGLLSTTPKAMDDTRRSRRTAPPPGQAPAAPFAGETPQPIRDTLARLSFPESVVWLFAKLADGLAHAHDRGIVHLDLKPANVLITDDGMPMILDFGLAHDVRDLGYAVTGGTVRYMSPEQLAGFVSPDGFVPDARMDLYSLGVMFFELLTGRHPFEDGPPGTSLPTLLAARRTVPPRVTAYNRTVSPAIAAVVAKLLQPDPADRYRSAHDLLTDLTRHQESRPLRHAGNPSLVERVRKFRRRHPTGTVAAVAFFFAVTATLALGVAINSNRERASMAAEAEAGRLGEVAVGARLDLPATEQVARRVRALAVTDAWFEKYGVGTDPKWAERSAVAGLSESSRNAVRRTLGEMAVLAAHAEELSAAGKGPAERKAAFDRAAAWNRRARTCFAGLPVPPVVAEQGERLAARTGDPAPSRPDDEAPVSSFDRYVRGVMALADGKYAAAAQGLEELVEGEPGHAAGQFSLGLAYQSQGRFAEALERLQLAKALSPTDHRPCHQRGMLLLASNRCADAVKEFNSAIEREPAAAVAYYHRAIARGGLGEWAGGAADATRAMELGEPAFRCLLFRARMKAAEKKDPTAAQPDRAAAAKLEPADEIDFVARGLDRLMNGGHTAADWQAALADFEKAAELNPRYLNAYQNQAYVLAEKRSEPGKAVEALDKAVALAPEFAPVLSARAVVLARLGRRTAAHADAEKALTLTRDGTVRYQVACVYALTSVAEPKDKPLAVAHFLTALRTGFADLDQITGNPARRLKPDADINAIRQTHEFRKALAAAKELRGD